MDRLKMMKDLHGEKEVVYEAKNGDYGDSFAKVRREYPEAIIIRLMDKLERLKTLYKGGPQRVSEETIEDTLLDMSNYAEMEIIERRIDRMKERKEIYNFKTLPEEDKIQKVIDELLKPMNEEEKPEILKKKMNLPVSDEVAKDHAEHYWEHRD